MERDQTIIRDDAAMLFEALAQFVDKINLEFDMCLSDEELAQWMAEMAPGLALQVGARRRRAR